MISAYGIVLIVCACILPIFTLAFGALFICYYGSREDKGLAWFPKSVMMVSLGLSFLTILLLPIDVANVQLHGGLEHGLSIFWQVLYGILAIFVVLVIPFAIFYYESEDPDKGITHQIFWGFIQLAVVLGIFILAVGISYYWLGKSFVPYRLYYQPNFSKDRSRASFEGVQWSQKYLETLVSIVVYITACLSIVGWFAFVVCGGMGLAALPLSCIAAFVKRERIMTGSEWMEIKNALKNRTERMIEIGEKLLEAQDQQALSRKDVRLFKDYQKAVYDIEKKWKITKNQLNENSFFVLKPILCLIIGIILLPISAILWIHILLYMALPKPVNPLLNYVLIWLDGLTSNFPALGAIVYGFFAFYLLFAVLAGNALIISRIPWVSVHPLRKGQTLINSLLYNVLILTLCSITLTQFVSEAFSGYARKATIVVFMDVLVKYLRGIYWFYVVAPYVYLAFALLGVFLSLVLLFLCKPKSEKEEYLYNILKDIRLESSVNKATSP